MKLFRIATIADTIDGLLKNQLFFLNKYFQVTAISSNPTILEKIRLREGVSIKNIEFKREISIVSDLKSLYFLCKYFISERPDIIHVSTPKASFLSLIAGALFSVKYRIYHVTGLRFESESGLKKVLLIFIERLSCFIATHVIAESQGVKNCLISVVKTNQQIYFVGNGNINGVDLDYWNPELIPDNIIIDIKRELGIQKFDKVFIFVGRLVKSKGINELLEAFNLVLKNYANSKLILLGDFDNNIDPISELTKEAIFNNQNVLSLGFMEDIRPYLAVSDALLLPSYREGFPNVILQAGSFGLPVIMTDVYGSDEYIKNFNGIIVNKFDSLSLFKQMVYIIEGKNDYQKDVIKDYVKNNYEQTYFYNELLLFYRKILGE
uniref:glycosyltransferase n=2 Tax=Flavobacterium sp. TaxID=239 RepID=UPI00404AFD57